jgi:hypothetical protein
MLIALLACHSPSLPTATPTHHPSAPERRETLSRVTLDDEAPTNWFWSDDGLAIDWASIGFSEGNPVFRTDGGSLRTGPVAGAERLACGEETRATLLFEDGALQDVHTFPDAPCVEDAAWAQAWTSLALDGARVGDVVHAVVVYDVPAEALCSSHC